ncbi:MAG: hypothetical protein FWD61_13480 [Phycisphaerales bacterium]|nr:hypothetical protein [Phycisphaerales bacterium]
MPDLRLLYESQITPQLDAALADLICLANPHEREIFRLHGRGWHGVKPLYCTFIEFNSQPIAYVGIADRTIRVGPENCLLRIAGPQNVSVHPNYRGQALSISALAHAMGEAQKLHFDAGLLFCSANLQRLYSKTGWLTLPNIPITRTQDNQDLPLPEHNIAMFLPLQTKTFPPGPIHLQGNDW